MSAAIAQLDACNDYRTAVGSTLELDRISTLTMAEMSAIRITSESLLTDDDIFIPRDWMPSGPLQQASARKVLLSRVTSGIVLDPRTEAQALLTLRRTILALWLVPRHSRRGAVLPKPSTFCNQSASLLKMARWALMNRPHPHTLFAHLNLDDVRAMVSYGGPNARGTAGIASELRMRGILTDWPTFSQNLRRAPGAERRRRGAQKPVKRFDASTPIQPLSDVFVSRCGAAALWMIEELGPTLVALLEEVFRRWPDDASAHLKADTLLARRNAIIRSWAWPENAARLDCQTSNARLPDFWPITSYGKLIRAATALQASHIFATALAMAARWSELADLRRDCLQPHEGTVPDRVGGRTFKMVETIGGSFRDWPVHPIAANAIIQQARMARIVAPESDKLWVAIWGAGNRGKPINDARATLRVLVEAFGNGEFLDGTLTGHRFRKTIARLAALALVGAPKILMDLLGHKTIATTLHYILSDPDLAAEIQDVARAQTIMLGKEVIKGAALNGGPAGQALRERGVGAMARRADHELGASDLEEAAAILTMNGRSCQLVRSNVLCTKAPGEAGPCTKRVGHPDPSRCRVDCGSRLELAAGRAEAEACIAKCVGTLGSEDLEPEMRAWWLGQLRHHLRRFEDVGARWLAREDVRRWVERVEMTA